MERKQQFEAGLTKILVSNKVLTEEEAKAMHVAFVDSEKEQLDEFLLDEGLVEEEDLLSALAQYYEVPAFDVVGYFFDTFQLRKFPKDFLLRNAIIPLEVDENIMIMIASEPNNPELLDKIGEHVSYDIRFRVGLRRDICDAVKEFYDKADTEESQDQDLHVEMRERQAEKRTEETEEYVPYEEEGYQIIEEFEEE